MFETSGYIKLHRSFVNWEWYQNEVVCRVYLHLLLTANFREDVWQGQHFTRGQVITGRKKLAETLHLSEQQVRTALNNLKTTGYITIETTNKYSLITIVNWENYQTGCVSTTYKATGKPTDNPHANQPQIKNINNIKNKEFKKSKKSAPHAKPNDAKHINGSGNYDYEQLRREARERIRRIIKEENLTM